MSKVIREFEPGDYVPTERYEVEFLWRGNWTRWTSHHHIHKAFHEAADEAYRQGTSTRVVDTWEEER